MLQFSLFAQTFSLSSITHCSWCWYEVNHKFSIFTRYCYSCKCKYWFLSWHLSTRQADCTFRISPSFLCSKKILTQQSGLHWKEASAVCYLLFALLQLFLSEQSYFHNLFAGPSSQLITSQQMDMMSLMCSRHFSLKWCWYKTAAQNFMCLKQAYGLLNLILKPTKNCKILHSQLFEYSRQPCAITQISSLLCVIPGTKLSLVNVY